MDTLTHALSGMLLARATVPAQDTSAGRPDRLPLRARLSAGFLAAAFPDIDFIVRLVDGPIGYLKYHRGVTHSILMLPLWAWLLSLGFMLLWRSKYSWKAFYGVCAMSLGIHILGDVITSFGTMILAPLSNTKFALPSTFIIDFWFSGIILSALLAAYIWRRAGQGIAVVGLTCLSVYVGFQYYLGHQATEIGRQYVRQQQLDQAEVHALPQPVSPFNWKVIVEQADQYHVSYLNLWRDKVLPDPGEKAGLFARVDALYRPVKDIQWQVNQRFGDNDSRALAEDIWQQQVLQDIREFMLFPMLYRLENSEQGLCAWYQDHRFILSDVRRVPFRFGACRNERQQWTLYRLDGNRMIPLS